MSSSPHTLEDLGTCLEYENMNINIQSIPAEHIYRRNKLDPSNPITPGMKLKLR